MLRNHLYKWLCWTFHLPNEVNFVCWNFCHSLQLFNFPTTQFAFCRLSQSFLKYYHNNSDIMEMNCKQNLLLETNKVLLHNANQSTETKTVRIFFCRDFYLFPCSLFYVDFLIFVFYVPSIQKLFTVSILKAKVIDFHRRRCCLKLFE